MIIDGAEYEGRLARRLRENCADDVDDMPDAMKMDSFWVSQILDSLPIILPHVWISKSKD
jgi:hypothetical protein